MNSGNQISGFRCLNGFIVRFLRIYENIYPVYVQLIFARYYITTEGESFFHIYLPNPSLPIIPNTNPSRGVHLAMGVMHRRVRQFLAKNACQKYRYEIQ